MNTSGRLLLKIDQSFLRTQFLIDGFLKPFRLETGLSDHHHLIYLMLKTTFEKGESKKINYRDYKSFEKHLINSSLNGDFETYGKNFVEVLKSYAPKKVNVINENEKPHLIKTLRNATMKRSRLKNKAYKSKKPTDIGNHERQRNYVVKLNCWSKEKSFLNHNNVDEPKPFRKTQEPYFSNTHVRQDSKIMLIEKEKKTYLRIKELQLNLMRILVK